MDTSMALLNSTTGSEEVSSETAQRYQEDGFFIAPPVVPADLLQRVVPRIEAVMHGEYETGCAPVRRWAPGDDPTKLRKINDAHVADRTIREFATCPGIGRWASAVTGARLVQLWASQLLYKPAGGSVTGNVGWHQDYQYWGSIWEAGSEVFTAWVAVSSVKLESGPMCFVRGSHHWGFLSAGDFFSHDRERTRKEVPVPPGKTWDEVPAILEPGAMSFHQALTFHGSGPNISQSPRISLALHLRTEKSKPVAHSKEHYIATLGDPERAPVIYRA